MEFAQFYTHRQRHKWLRVLLLALYLVVMPAYFGWRLTVLNTDHLIFSVLVLGAEMISLTLALMSVLILWRAKTREPIDTAPDGLKVDVFIPTYNEAPEMVRRTIIAALNIRYPHETWLLDDGDRPDLREMADDLGCRYLRRDDNQGAKPGNLNNALQFAKGDFIAVIDCDHVAQQNYLECLLGYFSDPQVAFVQAPQDYYNTNAFQFRNDAKYGLLWHDQTGFFNIGQAGRDHWGATSCCGTSTILRRSVVDEIGGFPEETVTEDIHVAIKAQKLGYKTAYVPKPLAFGVAPVDLGEFQRQRLRWGQGNVQALREEALPFTGKLSLAQNICYSYFGFYHMEGWTRLLFYMLPPIIIATGVMPLAPTHSFLWFFLPFLLVTILLAEELGRGDMRFMANEHMAMARFPVFILATFAIFRKRLRWLVSNKRFVGYFQPYLVAPQLAVLLTNAAAFAYAASNPNPTLLEQYGWPTYAFALFWCCCNSLLALDVIRHAIRCAANKRADYRFDVALPVELQLPDGRNVMAQTQKISAKGVTMQLEGAAVLEPETPLIGAVYIAGFKVPFAGVVEPTQAYDREYASVGELVTCAFEFDNRALQDRLDFGLHACTWHRKLYFDGPYFLTPLQTLAKWVGLYRDDRPEMTTRASMLIESQRGEQQLALLCDDGSGDPMMYCFTPFPEGTRLNTTWISGLGTTQRCYVIEEFLSHAEIVSSGPDTVRMYSARLLTSKR